MKPTTPYLIAGGVALLVVGGLVLYAWRRGGVAPAAASLGQAVGQGAVAAVGGAASGAVGAVGASVGLPTPAQTLTDARQVRWLIDRVGYFEASKWAGAGALLEAWAMASGSGTAPPASAPVMAALHLDGGPTPAASATSWPSWSAGESFEGIVTDPYGGLFGTAGIFPSNRQP